MVVSNLPLIDRSIDNEIIRSFIENVSPYRILNVHAIRGLGKTTFLKGVWNQYHKKLPIAFIRAEDFVRPDNERASNPEYLLHQIIDQLQSYLSRDGITETSASQGIEDISVLTGHLDTVIISSIENGVAPLILVDDYDHLLNDTRTAFEDIVLKSLFRPAKQTSVILTSERPLKFSSRPDLRIRSKAQPLRPLNVNDVQRSIPEYEPLASEIVKWTGGIPVLVGTLIGRFNKWNIVSFDQYHANEQTLVGKEYHNQVRNVVFSDIQKASREFIDVLALLRRFDVAVLGAILPKIAPDRFASYTQGQYFHLIRELGTRAYWREQGGYALDELLRTLLSSYVNNFEPELSEKVNLAAVSAYQNWLESKSGRRFLLEMLYHRAMLEKARGTSDEKITNLTSSIIFDYIEGRLGVSPHEIDDLDLLRHMLERDEDLRPFVEPNVLDRIDGLLSSGC